MDDRRLSRKASGAVLPIWLAVSVPPDAKAGDYKATVTISAEGDNIVSNKNVTGK